MRPSIPVIGIGASAGGITALQELFSALPPKIGAAVVVILHLDPTHASELAQILQLRTAMPVSQVSGRMPVEADHVYVIPPDRRLMISGSDIATAPFDEKRGQRAPIDLFFRSLAADYGDGCAVILSGSGSDGSIGVRAIKENGGIVLVQDPSEAEFPMMPRAAIAAGADFVLPLSGIATQLVDLVRMKTQTSVDSTSIDDDEVIRRILATVRSKTGQDFAHYKRATVARRITRRMQVVHADRLDDYFSYMRSNPEEVQSLFNDLLISVTSFFRDAQAYNVLAKDVIPRLFERDPGQPVRVWVPGCATGEEAYSIAILLLEEAAKREPRPICQVFASDLDAGALATARAGRYPIAIAGDVSAERLAQFFTLEGDHYVVRTELRDLVVFAVHGLLRDPPFSRLDLISCRNLMIYLERDLQEQACRTFAYALSPRGYLFLGASETAEHPPGLFTVVDREARIYRVNEQSVRSMPPLPSAVSSTILREPLETPRARTPLLGEALVHRQALEELAPPSMLVDAGHAIVNLSESAGRFLLPPGGRFTNDAAAMVRPELRLDLNAALHRAFEHGERTFTVPILVRFNGTSQSVSLHVSPRATGSGIQAALVLFLEGGAEEAASELTAQSDDSPLVIRLREELLASQTYLRTTRDQYEAAAEELRAANEELQSINEEYRSTSEELETSKEELQSINEELQTLNSELKLKLDLVSRSNNDLQNLMGATDIATLFLDKEMRIKRFTPRTTDLFNIHTGDEGRLVSDFSHRLEYPDLVRDAERVLSDLTPIERTVHTLDNRWLTTRLRPYRTIDDKIEGVVVTFFDITERRLADAAWAARQKMLVHEFSHRVKNTLAVVQSIVRQTLSRSPALTTDPDLIERVCLRLHALADAHDLLVSNDWTSTELGALLRTQLGPYLQDGRIQVAGDPVVLKTDIIAPLGLVLHELATNAVKYGALSTSTGRVLLSWQMAGNNPDTMLEIIWCERGGPPVSPPKRKGLGTSLIERAIGGATSRCDYDPAGITWTIRIPIRSIESSGVRA